MTSPSPRFVAPASRLRTLICVALLVLTAYALTTPSTARAAESSSLSAEITAVHFFEPLQHNVVNLAGHFADGTPYEANFLDSFTHTGGIERWGYPTSAVFEESPGNLTQYYQRGVVDWQPPPGGGHVFQRRLAWDYLGGGVGGSVDQGVELHLTNPNPGDSLGPWGHKVANTSVEGVSIGFADFFHRLGGIASFGFPKTDARSDAHHQAVLHTPGRQPDERIRQYFQAAVLEYHPETPTSPVKLSLLGDTLRDHRYPSGFWQQYVAFGPEAPVAVGDQLDLVLTSSRGPHGVTADDVARLLALSLLRVNTDRACGSGFFVTATGYAVTTWQLAADALTISVDSPRGYTAPAHLVAGDPERNIALIKVPGDSHIPVSWDDIPGLPLGHELLAYGHAATRLAQGRPVDCQSPPTATKVSISNPADPPGPTFLPSIDAGSAGGPLATHTGLVAGLVRSGLPGFPLSDRFTPAAAIRPLIDTWIAAVNRGTPPTLPHRPRFDPVVLFERAHGACQDGRPIRVSGSKIEISTVVTLNPNGGDTGSMVFGNYFANDRRSFDEIYYGSIWINNVLSSIGWVRNQGRMRTPLLSRAHEEVEFGTPFHFRFIYENGFVVLFINGDVVHQEIGLPYGEHIFVRMDCASTPHLSYSNVRITGFPLPNI